MTVNVQELNRMVSDLRTGHDPLYREIERIIIVGQRAMIDRLLVGLLTGGHMLLEGVSDPRSRPSNVRLRLRA